MLGAQLHQACVDAGGAQAGGQPFINARHRLGTAQGRIQLLQARRRSEACLRVDVLDVQGQQQLAGVVGDPDREILRIAAGPADAQLFLGNAQRLVQVDFRPHQRQ